MCRYPIILVHGIILKQMRMLNAFGQIGEELKKDGHTVYIADIDGFGSIESNASPQKA